MKKKLYDTTCKKYPTECKDCEMNGVLCEPEHKTNGEECWCEPIKINVSPKPIINTHNITCSSCGGMDYADVIQYDGEPELCKTCYTQRELMREMAMDNALFEAYKIDRKNIDFLKKLNKKEYIEFRDIIKKVKETI